MPSVQKSLKYDTAEFASELNTFVSGIQAQNKYVDVVVAAMPSYHHLKKSIMELRKNEQFVGRFEIKFVITKVKAANFYMTHNCNIYQFLIENCMKGIANAVIFEKSFIEQDKVAIMLRILESANPGGILPMTGRGFDLEELSQILMRQNDRLNMLYTKNFYGFEKEGKSDTYLEKQVSAGIFAFKYPVKLSELHDKLQPQVGKGLKDIDFLLPKSAEAVKEEEKEAAALVDKISKMSPHEKRKYELQQKRQARMQADLEPERKMKEGMDAEKRLLDTCLEPKADSQVAVMFERLRAIVLNEEDDTQDYELVVTADQISFRGLKNQTSRMADADRIVLAYGRNIEAGASILRDLMKLCRKQAVQRKALKKRDDMTEEQVQSLQEEFFNQYLPEGWYFDGSTYRTRDGASQFKHPNLDLLIQRHLDQVNDEIGEFNREIRKQVAEEQK